MKNFRLAFFLALIPALFTVQANADNARRTVNDETLVLENEYVRAEIDPNSGASLVSFLIKGAPGVAAPGDGIEMLEAPSFVDMNFLRGRRTQSFHDLPFRLVGDPSAINAQEVEWTLSAGLPSETPWDESRLNSEQGGGPWTLASIDPDALYGIRAYENIVITKSYRLRAGEASLRVEYELANAGDSPVSVSLGTRQSLKGLRDNYAVFVPSREGTIRFAFPVSANERRNNLHLSGSSTAWIYDLPAAWTATIDEIGRGAIAWFEPAHASFLQVDTSDGSVTVGRNWIDLAPGESFNTGAAIMPAVGLTGIVSAERNIACGVTVSPASADGTFSPYRRSVEKSPEAAIGPPTAPTPGMPGLDDGLLSMAQREEGRIYTGDPIRAEFRIASATPMMADVSFTIRRNPRGEPEPLAEETVNLGEGPQSIRVSARPRLKGTYIIRAEVRNDGKTTAVFERPIVVDTPSGFFTPEAPERAGRINDEYLFRNARRASFPTRGDWQPSNRVQTDHAQYARPIADRPIRAILATPYWSAREAVELAQRIDIESDVVTVGKPGYRQKFTQYYGVTMNEAALDEIEMMRRFLADRHDVIILLNLFGDWFPADIMEEIERQVDEDGVGLVMVYPDQMLGPIDALSRAARRRTAFFAETRARNGEFGEGRVAVFDGSMQHTHRPYFRAESDYEDFARMVVWAARGEPRVSIDIDAPRSIERAALAETPISLTLENNADQPFKGFIRAVPRRDLVADYPFYNAVPLSMRYYDTWEQSGDTFETDIELAPNDAETAGIAPLNLASGTHSIDIYVLDEAGGVVNWHRVPLNVRAEASIEEMAVASADGDRIVFRPDGQRPFFAARQGERLSIELRAVNCQPDDFIRITGVDPWGRIVFLAEEALDNQRSATFNVSLHSAAHRILVIKAELIRDNRPITERRARIFVHDDPDRAPLFELRAYEEVTLNPDEAAYDVRVGGGGAEGLAWFNISQTEYGGWIPHASEILTPFDIEEEAPPEDIREMPPTGPRVTDDTALLLEEIDQLIPAEEDKDGDAGGKAKLRKDWIRVPCLNDPEWRDSALSSVERRYRERSFFGPYKGFSVDEWFYYKEPAEGGQFRRGFEPGRHTNICRCKYCMERFIAYSREIFGNDLNRLNRAWNTEFTEWDDVNPPLLNREAPPESMWAHIIDHRHFIDLQLPEVLGEARKLIEAIDPGCQTGLSGMWTTGLWVGLDIYQLAKHCRYNMLYRDIDVWTSFGAGGGVHWGGYGGKYNPIREHSVAWRQLFAGMSGYGYYGKEITPMRRPDHTFHHGPMGMFEAMREIRQKGYDRLLMGNQTVDPAAIYYAPRDIYIAGLEEWLEDARAFISNWRNAGRAHSEFPIQVGNSYRGLLNQRHIQPFWVSYGHLEEGNFGGHETPGVLLLPYAQNISDRQAEFLERFVREGGVIVGDVGTGVRDGHGALRENGALDAVFGIRRGDWEMRTRADESGKAIPVNFGGAFGEQFSMTFAAVESGEIRLDGAAALASYMLNDEERPAFIVNEYGAGKAILLNFIPAGYRAVEMGGVEGEEVEIIELEGEAGAHFRRIFDKIIELAEIEQPITADYGARISRFASGDIDYICMTTSYRNAHRGELSTSVLLPRLAHLYDARRGEYLGYSDQFAGKFEPQTFISDLLITALPYRVEGIDIELEKGVVAPGERVKFTVRVAPKEAETQRHVVAVQLIGPDGAEHHWYNASLETENGRASGEFGIAFNDQPGIWSLRARDAATGTVEQVAFEVAAD